MSSLPDKVELIFRKPVAEMLEQANLFHTQLTADLADFTAEDSTMDAAYLTAFQTAITAAETAETPEMAEGVLMDLTAETDNLMEQARNSVQGLYRALENAFPNQAGKMRSYGKQTYEKARNSKPLMVVLMDDAAQQMVADTAALIAAGYAQAKIDAFGTLLAELKSTRLDQENQKGLNLDVTADYYTTLNAVWSIMSDINEVAMIVYRNNFAKRETYLLYDDAPGAYAFSLDTRDEPVRVWHSFLQPISPTQVFRFRILDGDGEVVICFATAVGETCAGPQKFVSGSEEVEFTYADFGGAHLHMGFMSTNNTVIRIRTTIVPPVV